MNCPKCDHQQPDGSLECGRCGVIFAKWETTPILPRRKAVVVEEDEVEDGRIGRRELIILGFGLGAAILANAVPLLWSLFHPLVSLVHELGHAVAGWLLGHPSLPAFDFMFGGGLTHLFDFRLPLALAVVAGFGWLGWRYRRNPKSLAVIASVFVVWLVAVSAEWRRETVIAAAGNTTEVILAAVLFYQALAGVGWRIPELERPLGAFAAFFIQIRTMTFAYDLMNNPDAVEAHKRGKGGGAIFGDLEIVSLNLRIHTDLSPSVEDLATFLFLFSFVPIAVALGWHLFRTHCHRVVRSLLITEAG